MCVGTLLVVFVVCCGCAGPDVSPRHGLAEFPGNVCPSERLSSGPAHAEEARCLPPSSGWTRVSEALSGAATVVRMPRP